MINFFHKGGMVGFSLSGWMWVPIIIFLIFEFISITVTRMSTIGKLYYYFKVKRLMKKVMPYWWRLKVNVFLIGRTDQISPTTGNRVVDIPIVAYHVDGVTDLPLNFHNHNRITDSITVMDHKYDYSFISRIRQCDEINKINTKQLNRDKILDEIGVK